VGQLTPAVVHLTKGEINSLRLQLHPAELGPIDLRLAVEAEGTQVTILADLPETGLLIERHLASLRQSLQEAGVNLAGLTVGQGAVQGGPAGGKGEPRAGARTAHLSKGSAPHAASLAEVTRLSLEGSAGRVDYRV
jgi:flagellar hook-length control protein FliK